MARIARISLLVTLLFSLFAPAALAAGDGAAPEEVRAEKLILKAVNKYRANKLLPPLVDHTFIKKESRKHSNYMGNHGELSHDGQVDRFQRIADDDGGTDVDKMCEVTASAQGYDLPGPVAKRIVNAWKKNGTSRACITDVDFNSDSVGIGVQKFGDAWYATLIAANDTTP